jgi:hypothetical protein
MTKRRMANLTALNVVESKGQMYGDFLALDGYQTVPFSCYETDEIHYIEARLVQKRAICRLRGVSLPIGKAFEEFTFTVTRAQ